MATEKLSGYVWELEWCSGRYRHWKGARAHMGIGRVPGTYRQQKGVREQMDTGKVPDTYRKQKVAWIHIGTSRVPRHIWVP